MADRKCTKCLITKPVEQFYLNCYGRNGACKPCVAAKNKAYYEANKARIAAEHKGRKDQGVRPDIGAQARRAETPFDERYAQRRADMNARKRERLQTDPQFRAMLVVDTRFRRAIADWSSKLEELVSCPADRFRDWIEFQFGPEMTWDNYGAAWVYDHIEPRADYDLTDADQIAECYRWTNLRPLPPSDNSIKHDKALTPEEKQIHEMNLHIFNILQ
jgi:hypothetical protein